MHIAALLHIQLELNDILFGRLSLYYFFLGNSKFVVLLDEFQLSGDLMI
jgi:hypothetical protein